MASPAQILANRENAQLSSGPTTQNGKTASSRNATRHGLTSTQIVMPGEDAAAYEDLRRGFHETYRPANEGERILVDQIAANAWRLMRAQRVETAFFGLVAEQCGNNGDAGIAMAFLERPKEVARMQRYVTAAHNAYYKAISELTKLQKQRSVADEDSFTEPALAEAEYEKPSPRHDAPSASLHESYSMLPDLHLYSDSGQTAENCCS
jgi:hypothetical protein